MKTQSKILIGIGFFMALMSAAQAQVKVAVTNLAYKETVRDYIHIEAESTRASATRSVTGAYASNGYSEAAAVRDKSSAKYSHDRVSVTKINTKINRSELLNFTSEIKGNLIKAGLRVQEAKPYTANNEQLYDVIKRIKGGYFPGADYVLFGVISSINWRNEQNSLPGLSENVWNFGLELGADFSLINTKTFEVKAAFNAVGVGQDNKIYAAGGLPNMPNKALVMQQATRSLAEQVSGSLGEQFAPVGGARGNATRRDTASEGKGGTPVPTSAPVEYK